jgi:hypothetical protein
MAPRARVPAASRVEAASSRRVWLVGVSCVRMVRVSVVGVSCVVLVMHFHWFGRGVAGHVQKGEGKAECFGDGRSIHCCGRP